LSASAEHFIPSSELVAYTHVPGQDKMRSGADLWGGSPLVSFNHVTDPHCHFLQQIRNPNPNPSFYHWSADPQFVTVQIRPADSPRSAFYSYHLHITICSFIY